MWKIDQVNVMESIKASKKPIVVSAFKFDSKEIRKEVETALQFQLEELIDNTNWSSLKQFISTDIHLSGVPIKCFISINNDGIEYLKKIDITKQIIMYSIDTLEGERIISDGDYVITEKTSLPYICENHIFKKTYDIIE